MLSNSKNQENQSAKKVIRISSKTSLYFFEKRDYFRPFDKFRYWIYRLTDINPNKNRLSTWLIISIIYNVVMTVMPLVAIVPIIMNYAAAPSLSSTTNSIDITQYENFNRMMGKYMYVEYVFSFILLLDWCVRVLYCDYKYPLVVKRWRAIFSYIFNPYNLYQLSSSIILIVLFATYGSVDNHSWFIDLNVLGASYNNINSVNHAEALYNSWNPGELIFVSLYIANIVGIVPRVVLGFKEQTPFKSKTSLWAIIKNRWKTPVIATIFLIVLLFVFSFLILKTEQSYYSEWAANHPDLSLENDAPNYSSSPKNIGQSLWYCLITVTTVGYGQIIPQSPAGRVIAVVLVILGISYYSFYTVFFVSTYTKFIDKNDQIEQDKLNEIQKQKDQEQLVKTIKEEFVEELLKYGVIQNDKYNQVKQEKQQQLQQEQIALSQQATQQAKSMLNSHLIVEHEESRLKSWIQKYNFDNPFIKNKENVVLSESQLLDNFSYEIINKPDLKSNYQAIMVKLDSNIVNTIFNSNIDERINLFFKKIAPTYNVKKIIVVDKLLNKIIGEVAIKDILLTTPDIAWEKYGSQSGEVKQMYDVEFSTVSLVYIYLIEARKKYQNPVDLDQFDVDKNQLPSFVFLKQINK